MKLNKFLWNNYKETEQGKRAIELFSSGATSDILHAYFKEGVSQDATDFIDDLTDFSISPILPDEIIKESAENLFSKIIKNGFSLKLENEEVEEIIRSF